jgi:hypothetical protein
MNSAPASHPGQVTAARPARLASRLRQTALAGLVAGSALSFHAAQAAAPVLSVVDLGFYTAPAIGSAAKGDLLRYRTATVNLGNGAPAVQAWNVLYRSTDAVGAANVVSGTVIVPATAWSGTGARPMVGYAVGTHGLAQGCAPSIQMARGSDYEAANIAAALNKGYAVLVSDYAGYTTGSTPTYLAGKSQGQAVLDLFRAASLVPGAGLSASAKTAIWGFSQGGQSAAWAGELKSTYAPNLNLTAIAAGGVPADFINTAGYLDGSTGASFLLQGIIGLAEQYPAQIPLDTYTNATGQAAVVQGKQGCVFDNLFPFMNHNVAEYTVGNKPLNDFFAIPSINQAVTAQNLGNGRISVPLLQYHGRADEFIPIAQHVALKRKYCGKFMNTTFHVYPSEHIVTQFQAAPTVLGWLGDRFAGKSTLGTCLTLAATPTSTANPGGGDFVVSMKSWPLSGVLNLKTLAQSVALPEGSTFTADANMTQGTIKGSMAIPTFTGTIKVAGLPADVKMMVTEAAPTTGSASLDTDGLLHVHGMASVNIQIVSAGVSVLQLPVGCRTSAPVLMPIDYDGPLSALGNGNLVFNGTTTFPPMTDCGLYTSLFTALMSGPGQTYSISVKPPAPTTW